MYIPSEKYIEASKKTSRNPKSKIIIDGVEYTGMNIIKTHPLTTHDAQKMVGEFPTKECKFTIFNREDNIDVVNKDIEVYRGLVLEDNTIEYIPQGVFHATQETIKSNSTAKTIELAIKDKSVEFDNLYGGIEFIEYPTTINNFIKEIIERRGFVLETPLFPFSDFVLNERPNFDLNSTSERTLIAKAALLGGCTVQMSRSGGVRITKPFKTGAIIKKTDYKTLSSKEKKFGPVNVVTIGKTGINDDIQFRDETSINLHGECEWKILDNPFVDLIRKETVDKIASNIIGMSIIPFELKNCVDSYLYDINDSVEAEDKLGNIFETTILTINSSSRIFTGLKSAVQTSEASNQNLAGSSKAGIESIRFDVNHVKQEMELVVEKVDESVEQVTRLSADIDGIQQEVSKFENDAHTVNDLKITVENIEQKYEKTGGRNKIRNSVGLFNYSENEYWINSESGNFVQGYDQRLVGITESASRIGVQNGNKKTTSNNIENLIVGKEIFLTYKLTNEKDTITTIRLVGNNILYEETISEEVELQNFEIAIVPDTSKLTLEVISTTTMNGWTYVSDLMLGDTKLWELAEGETWSRIIETNPYGQLIKAQDVDTALFMGMEGLSIYEMSSNSLGNKVGSLTKDGLITKDIECVQIVQNKLVNTNIGDTYVRYIRSDY